MVCKKRKTSIVSDNTIQAEGLGDFFKNWRRSLVKQLKNQQILHSRYHLESLKSVQMSQQRPQVEKLKQLYQQYLK